MKPIILVLIDDQDRSRLTDSLEDRGYEFVQKYIGVPFSEATVASECLRILTNQQQRGVVYLSPNIEVISPLEPLHNPACEFAAINRSTYLLTFWQEVMRRRPGTAPGKSLGIAWNALTASGYGPPTTFLPTTWLSDTDTVIRA